MFPSLFSPLPLKSFTVRNRVFQPAMSLWFSENQRPSQRMADFYGERARGGVGLIVQEPMYIHPTSEAHPWIAAFDTANVDGLARIADAVHRWEGRIAAQLIHNGRQMTSWRSKRPTWGVTAVPDSVSRETPHAMTTDEVRELIEHYVISARNAQRAGYDGVEIHAAHGYLPQQFIDESINTRSDEYGGSFENRMRFLLEVVAGIREACGGQFSVGVQINATDGRADGMTPELAARVAQAIDAQDLADYLSITIGIYLPSSVAQAGDMAYPEGPYVDLAADIKRQVRMPVGTMSRIKRPEFAESVIASGKADYVAIGRALLSDPEWPNKARDGVPEEIRPCIAANEECRKVGAYYGSSCVHNPAVGFEARYGAGTLTPAATPATILVVGGGPAGLEAAIWAARRGHRVTLADAADRLGGQINLAIVPPLRREFGELTEYQRRQIDKLDITVQLGRSVTATDPDLSEYDHVVIATGALPLPVRIPGSPAFPILDVWQALGDPGALSGRIVILEAGDASWQSAALPEFFLERGHDVVALTENGVWGAGIPAIDQSNFQRRLAGKGIRPLTATRITGVSGTTIHATRGMFEEPVEIADVGALVGWMGARVVDDLYQQLRERHPSVHVIGDAASPRRTGDAVREGFHLGRTI